MSLRVIWQYMDRSVTKKNLYGPLRSFGPYSIFLVTDRSIYCHMTLSAMNYLLYRYQRGNYKPQIEGQTIQWPKEKGQTMI
jgi:hypothetical protein